jgi:hypothetical protein
MRAWREYGVPIKMSAAYSSHSDEMLFLVSCTKCGQRYGPERIVSVQRDRLSRYAEWLEDSFKSWLVYQEMYAVGVINRKCQHLETIYQSYGHDGTYYKQVPPVPVEELYLLELLVGRD